MYRVSKSYILFALLIGAIIGGFLLPSYYQYLATQIFIFGIVALAFNLLYGYTGLLSFGQAIFFGIGAYSATLSLIYLNVNPPIAIILSILVGFITSLLIGSICVRVTNAYFLILTLIICIIAYLVALNQVWLTGGSDGINLPEITLKFQNLSLSFWDSSFRYYFSFLIFIIISYIFYKISNSQIGIAFKAIRENENLAKTLGYNTYLIKLISFCLAGTFTSLAGALYSLLFSYATAEFFSLTLSIKVVIWVLLGGAGTIMGPIIGTGLLLCIFDFVSSLTPNHPIIIGVLLMLSLKFKRGIYYVAANYKK